MRAIRLVEKYRMARRAKLELDGPGDWEQVFRELRNEDVRSYASGKKRQLQGRRGIWEDGSEPVARPPTDLMESDSEEESDIEVEEVGRQTENQLRKARKKGTGETRKELSWIWTTAPMGAETADEANEILRSEWAKRRARRSRSREEVLLLLEEMRRVLEFLEWKATWWDGRWRGLPDAAPALAEGLRSYAVDQAMLQRSLAASFRLLWRTPLANVDTVVEEAERELDAEDGIDGIEFSNDAEIQAADDDDIDSDDEANANEGNEDATSVP